jgi:hypothetical protein
MNDPQNMPPPEHQRAPSRFEELIMSFLKLTLIVIRVTLKLAILMVLGLVALIAALTWGK